MPFGRNYDKLVKAVDRKVEEALAVKITAVQKNSPAEKAGLAEGVSILSIDGNEIHDMLDYEFYSTKARLELAVCRQGKLEYLSVKKEEYEPLGCDFETFLIDKKHSCRNKCMFCFIDQLPKGLRDTLYFKDDDERLSFLYGNYITLTNLSPREVERVKRMHISPINISVHTVDPALRVKMMTNKHAGEVLRYIDEFAEAGIEMNCQLVLCPGVNDGAKLAETLDKLTGLYPSVRSIAAVPFGKTRYREGLYPLKTYDKETASQTLDILEHYGNRCLAERGIRLVYPSDEWFLLAERAIPPEEYYDGYPQIENGVGMWRKFYEEFMEALAAVRPGLLPRRIDTVTGESAYPLISLLAQRMMQKDRRLRIRVHKIKNDFFGGNVSVAGLITATDIIRQLRGHVCSRMLFVPEVMLREEKDLFLDNLSVKDVEKALRVKVKLVPQDGAVFAKMLNKGGESLWQNLLWRS